MGVSKIEVPQNGWEKWKTLLKWMIWGYHYSRKHPYKTNQDFMECRGPRMFVEKLLRWKLTTCFILFAMLALLAHRKLLACLSFVVFLLFPQRFRWETGRIFFWGGWKMMKILLFVYRAAIFRYIFSMFVRMFQHPGPSFQDLKRGSWIKFVFSGFLKAFLGEIANSS